MINVKRDRGGPPKYLSVNENIMKGQINTSINIKASAESIWKILMDFENYSAWNPFIKSINGKVEQGQKIHVEIDGMKFQPRVQVFDRNREFQWLGHLFIPGIFDGQHRFQLEDNGDGTTTFRHSERFSGILVGAMKKMLKEKTTPGFMAMNEALKERAEAEFAVSQNHGLT